ncbi:crossover junction endodeoxyribonuclease RuvC [Paenibacillus sp. GCM10012307]|uniref:Crossover junction endodeoxyribonuclease RuvC n=1 Tax=Paenibacillus roseus TaxID=2798579 RepID=A0A934JCA8_9BACL|nr:crossover junction endodeoxyribonuclease RuvC [Paenibacillus roseus]
MATLLKTDSTPTESTQQDGLRYSLVESSTVIFASQFKRPHAIIREDYLRPANKRQGQAIYGAWAAVDTGLQRCGLQVTAEINATTVKRIVGGHGKAEKSEVADGVRRLLRLPADHTFTNYDESDAAAIVLAWLIEQGRIDG